MVMVCFRLQSSGFLQKKAMSEVLVNLSELKQKQSVAFLLS